MVFDPCIDILKPGSVHKFQAYPVPKLTPCLDEPTWTPESNIKNVAQKIQKEQAELREKTPWHEVKGVRYQLDHVKKSSSGEQCAGNCFEPYPHGNLTPLDHDHAEELHLSHLIEIPELDDEELPYYGFTRLHDGEYFVNYERHLAIRAIYIGEHW